LNVTAALPRIHPQGRGSSGGRYEELAVAAVKVSATTTGSFQFGRIWAQLIYNSDHGVPGSEGRPRAARIPPAADVHVGEPHVSRQNLDKCLAATWNGQVVLDDLQDLGPSELTYHDMPIFHAVISGSGFASRP
jgi:hypothetical protein